MITGAAFGQEGEGTDAATGDNVPSLSTPGTSDFGDVQDIITASDFFDRVSDRYAEIEDFQADVVFTYPDTTMSGTLYHKRPDMLLIEYDDPEDQVISVDGVHLQVYIPYLDVVMDQPLRPRDDSAGFGIATHQGLELMRSRYSIAYLDSQDYVPIDDFSNEMVRKLRLEWKNIGEGFREIILSVNEDLLIRRIEASTSGQDTLTIDFTNIVLNQGLPSRMFVWDSPPSANLIRNFIFQPDAAQ